MSFSSTQNKISYSGNSSTTTPYTIPFPFFDSGDLLVTLRDTSADPETESTLTETTEYAVSGGSGDTGSIMTVTAYASTYTIIISRSMSHIQTADYDGLSNFRAASHEDALDKSAMRDAQLAEKVERSFKVSMGSADPGDLVVDANEDLNKVLVLDATGTFALMTGAQIQSLLSLPATVVDQPTKTFTDSSARALAVPDFEGQVAAQLDTDETWVASGATAGDWVQKQLIASNNLSDVGAAATARSNIGANSAANLDTGELPDARLSSNIAMTNVAETFTDNVTVQGNTVAEGQAYSELHALTDAATIAVDCDNGNVFSVTLGGNRTLGAPSNLKAGATYAFIITQDGTGSRTLSYNSVYKFPGGTAPTLTTAASSVDIIGCISDGTDVHCTSHLNLS